MIRFLLLGVLFISASHSAFMSPVAFFVISSKKDAQIFFGKKTGSILFTRAALPFDHDMTTHLSIKHFPPIQIFFEEFFEPEIMNQYNEIIFSDSELNPFFSIRRLEKHGPLELNVNLSDIKLRFNKQYATITNLPVTYMSIKCAKK